MREVDRALRELGGRAPFLFESHPELCFAALNAGRPLGRSKRHALGILDRAFLLEPHLGDVRSILHRALHDVPPGALSGDDALDAMVLAVHARLAFRHGMVSLPDTPERDALGLPMGIAFAAATDPREPGSPGRDAAADPPGPEGSLRAARCRQQRAGRIRDAER
jgi:predicted RNase H-like nuclease